MRTSTSQPGRFGRSRWTALRRSAHGPLGGGRQVAVGLVDDDQVGELHDPALDALELVAAGRRGDEHEEVDEVGHRHLGLADADRLDEHDVEPGRLAQQQRLARAAGHAAERARRTGDGRMKALGVPAEVGHAGLVAEDRAAGAGARRVDGEHRDPVARRRWRGGRAPR